MLPNGRSSNAEWQPVASSRLRDIAARGTRVRLRNVQAYRSELAWVQFLTGQTTSDLGWWGQLQFDPAT